MRSALEAMLRGGAHDENAMAAEAAATCGRAMTTYLTDILEQPAADAATFIQWLATSELDRIPDSPPLEPLQDPPISSHPEYNALRSGLSRCALEGAQTGPYSSADGGVSADLVLRRHCPNLWENWVSVCMASGDSRDVCVQHGLALATEAIRKAGK